MRQRDTEGYRDRDTETDRAIDRERQRQRETDRERQRYRVLNTASQSENYGREFLTWELHDGE